MLKLYKPFTFFYIAVASIITGCDPARTPDETGRADAGPDRPAAGFYMTTDAGERLEVRLAEVRIARSGRAGENARARLSALVREAGGGLELVYTGAQHDRYGRAVAHVEFVRSDASRVWIQGELVEAGLATVSTYADNRARAGRLLALEREARAAGRGAWGEGVFAVRDTDPDRLAQRLDSFQIVEGRVIDANAARSGRVYLNFGLNWRSDFTVSVSADNRVVFDEAGVDLLSLEGARVRVRGWLYQENGPMIAIDHPEALEILDAPAPDWPGGVSPQE